MADGANDSKSSPPGKALPGPVRPRKFRETLDPTYDRQGAEEQSCKNIIKPGKDPRQVTSWVYKNERLPAPPAEIDDKSSVLEITSYYFDQVLRCNHKDSLRIISDHSDTMVIYRLIDLKHIIKGLRPSLNIFTLSRQQQYSAIVGHLFAQCDPGMYSPCQTCASSRSEGPFRVCVYDKGELFKMACTNCQAKSTASKCSLRLGNGDTKTTITDAQPVIISESEESDFESSNSTTVAKSVKHERPQSSSSSTGPAPLKRVRMVKLFDQGRTDSKERPATSAWVQQASDSALTLLKDEITAELAYRYGA